MTRAQLSVIRGTSWYTDLIRLRDIGHDRGPFTLSVTLLRDAERIMRGRQVETSPVIDEDGYALGGLALSC